MLYHYLQSILFALDPERIHHWSLKAWKLTHPAYLVKKHIKQFRQLAQDPVTLWGLSFPNRIGLAAGLDKDGQYIDALFGMGFGFLEVGAVTPKPQDGNPKPRLFRLPDAGALINRFGFNNLGVDHLVARLKQRKVPGIVGVNIGKNAITPIEEAYHDYLYCLEKVYPYADYVSINISSPNTEQLRKLQAERYLDGLLKHLKEMQRVLIDQQARFVPLLVKVSPDLPQQALRDIAQLVLQHDMDGIIAVNTTRSRMGVTGLPHGSQEGGLSGQPLLGLTLRAVQCLYTTVGNQVPIIGVGGIATPEDMRAVLDAGASLIQLYTALIYQGPRFVHRLLTA